MGQFLAMFSFCGCLRLASVASLALAAPLGATLGADMSPAAKAYLDSALDIIKSKSVMRTTDWAKMRTSSYAAAKNAQKPSDTYAAISAALASLGDSHSSFITPAQMSAFGKGSADHIPGMTVIDCYVLRVVPDGPAAKAGLQSGMHVIEVNEEAVAYEFDYERIADKALATGDGRLTLTAVDRQGHRGKYLIVPATSAISVAPSGRWLPGGYGYIDVPAFLGEDSLGKAYANKLQDAIRLSDRDGLKGWIVDIRLNEGGNMYPMIAGLGPLLGEGDLGSFLNASSADKWGYSNGSSLEGGNPQTTITPYKLKHPNRPIAVLIDDATASSGEIVAISFVGGPRTTLIGSETAGLTTANSEETLSDGAVANLCEAIDADRKGKKYGDVVHPNIRVKPNWSTYGTDRDVAIVAAKRWIDGRMVRSPSGTSWASIAEASPSRCRCAKPSSKAICAATARSRGARITPIIIPTPLRAPSKAKSSPAGSGAR